MPGGYREETLTLHGSVHTRDWYYPTDQSDGFQWTSYSDTFKLVTAVGGFFPPASSAAVAARSALASRAILSPSSMKAATSHLLLLHGTGGQGRSAWEERPAPSVSRSAAACLIARPWG